MNGEPAASPFGARLRRWRAHRGISQLALAAKVGSMPRHVSFLETGRSRPSRDMVLRLGDALGMTLRERNQLLHAAGLPAACPQSDLGEEAWHHQPVRRPGRGHRAGDHRLPSQAQRCAVLVVHEDRRRRLSRPKAARGGRQPVHRTTDEIKAWLAKHPRITLHFTPTGSSWLNMVEIWFGIITRQAIRRGTFKSLRQLPHAIEDYATAWNTDAKPFIWTATADEILAKVRWVHTEVRKLLANNSM